MPNSSPSPPSFSLLEVTTSITRVLEARYKSEFWVRAEMNKLNYYSQSGHCFPELVEKREGKIVAQMKAAIWRNEFFRINNNFRRVLKEPLKDGIKILFLARITFHPVYGLSLVILDIDPAYTLGDLEREKQETIDRLREEGIFDRNKRLSLPLLPQRIAIISVETSKGYADFKKVIEGNPWQYKFFHLLFPSLLQGEKAVPGIISQLNRIRKVLHHFDVVAIIRGGGGDIGLSCYNNYALAKEIALFPIPVITGIGHATNETVAEMISHSNAITPTKLAEMLLQKFHDFARPVQEAERGIMQESHRLLREERQHFSATVKAFRMGSGNALRQNREELRNLSSSLVMQSNYLFRGERDLLRRQSMAMVRDLRSLLLQARAQLSRDGQSIGKNTRQALQRERLAVEGLGKRMPSRINSLLKHKSTEIGAIEKNVFNLSPANVLRRGYSITKLGGKSLRDAKELKPGEVIHTILYNGSIESEVTSTKNEKEP